MDPKSLRRLLGAALLSLICSVSSFAQSYTNWGDLERARAQQIQRQKEMNTAMENNQRLMRLNFGKGVVDARRMDIARHLW